MTIYFYTSNTNVFCGVGEADPNPVKEGDYILPAFATTVEPPKELKENEQAIWSGEAWEVQKIILKESETANKNTPDDIPLTWDVIRQKRNILLYETDWVGLTDCQLLDKQPWLTYRQNLRDVTKNFASPESVVWPALPLSNS